MGYNTTVVVMNDALDAIAKDPEFGEKLKSTILGISLGINPDTGQYYRSQDVSAGHHVNAATVIESHHASYQSVVVVGGNYGSILGHSFSDPKQKLAILNDLASEIGYTLHKKE